MGLTHEAAGAMKGVGTGTGGGRADGVRTILEGKDRL